ncbi:hypothetical protein [Nesterenkonia muleiensis]|uniref:hypothetical protein n=1 Tax=Nesterenkonia muleiensis TaxID=2282648 RepID=UPI000E736061|nr:hypothetical protein [Nesterenkonia muleiensis]
MRTSPHALTIITAAAATLLASSCANPFGNPETEPSATASSTAAPDSGTEEAPTDAASDAAAEETAAELAVPHSWLAATSEEWPSTEGFASYNAVSTQDDQCHLLNEVPDFLGHAADITRAAWGGFGQSPDNPEAYRHICQFHSPDNYAGTIALIQGSTPDEIQEFIDDFLDQPDIPEQDNDVMSLEVDGVEMHALQRWYPTNPSPHGEFQAIFHDSEADAVAYLEVNSLYDDDFDNYSHELIAEDLISILRSTGD